MVMIVSIGVLTIFLLYARAVGSLKQRREETLFAGIIIFMTCLMLPAIDRFQSAPKMPASKTADYEEYTLSGVSMRHMRNGEKFKALFRTPTHKEGSLLYVLEHVGDGMVGCYEEGVKWLEIGHTYRETNHGLIPVD